MKVHLWSFMALCPKVIGPVDRDTTQARQSVCHKKFQSWSWKIEIPFHPGHKVSMNQEQ